MDDGHFGYITKALIHSFAPETLLPSACTTFLLEEEPTDHQLIFQPVSKYLSNQTEIWARCMQEQLPTHFESKVHLQLAYMYFQRTKHGFTTQP